MYSPSADRALAASLSAAFLAGPWDAAGLRDRGARTLTPVPRWLPTLVEEVLAGYHRPALDRPRELAAFIAVFLEDRRARGRVPPRVRRRWFFTPQMGRMRWPVPEIATPGALADRLGVTPGHLDWLADVRSLERTAPDERLRHYRYAWRAREGGPFRVLEQPKPRLKAIQRRVLGEILEPIAVHDAAHGFRRGHSARTHAAAHTGQRVVLRLDLADFFAWVSAARIYGVYRLAGYPEAVAHALTGLTTNAVPVDEWAAVPRPAEHWAITAHHRLGRHLTGPHLPQGAPTSPALANLCAYGLDRRLAALAAASGARYTRYADDLAFSGGRETLRRSPALRRRVAAIAREEGFRVNERKSQLMTDAGRQRLAGVVVNQRPNVSRGEYDALKAILHNAALRGPEAENRAGHPDFRAHLLGRIAWVAHLNPGREAKLRERFARIEWPD